MNEDRLAQMSLRLAHAIAQCQQFKDDGNALYKRSAFDKALECYDRALTLIKEEKIESFQRVLDIAVDLHNNKAACYLAMNKNDLALVECSKSLILAPSNSNWRAVSRRAKAYERLGRFAEAVESYKLATEINPSDTASKQAVQRILKELEKNNSEMIEKMKLNPKKLDFLSALPSALLEMIFTYLPLREQLRAGRTNRATNLALQLAKKHQTALTPAYLTSSQVGYLGCAQFVSVIQSLPALETIDSFLLDHFIIIGPTGILSITERSAIFDRCRKLRDLLFTVDELMIFAKHKALPAVPPLRSFLAPLEDLPLELLKWLDSCPTLEHVSLGHYKTDLIPLFSSNSGSNSQERSLVTSIATRCPALSVYLPACLDEDEEDPHWIPPPLPPLPASLLSLFRNWTPSRTSLSLAVFNVEYMSSVLLSIGLASMAASLTSLHFDSYCRSSVVDMFISHNWIVLSDLKLYPYNDCADEVLDLIVAHCPALNNLHFTWMAYYTDQDDEEEEDEAEMDEDEVAEEEEEEEEEGEEKDEGKEEKAGEENGDSKFAPLPIPSEEQQNALRDITTELYKIQAERSLAASSPSYFSDLTATRLAACLTQLELRVDVSDDTALLLAIAKHSSILTTLGFFAAEVDIELDMDRYRDRLNEAAFLLHNLTSLSFRWDHEDSEQTDLCIPAILGGLFARPPSARKEFRVLEIACPVAGMRVFEKELCNMIISSPRPILTYLGLAADRLPSKAFTRAVRAAVAEEHKAQSGRLLLHRFSFSTFPEEAADEGLIYSDFNVFSSAVLDD